MGRISDRIGREQQEQLLLQMGMLFQKNALFDSLTVAENIAFPLREKSSLSEKEIQKKVEYFLEAVGIDHAKELFPDEISGGMQKRLGIARALALGPKIVLYDDPTLQAWIQLPAGALSTELIVCACVKRSECHRCRRHQ